jgi:hypothetical protein
VAPRRCGLAPSDTSEMSIIDSRTMPGCGGRNCEAASPLGRRSEHPSPGQFSPNMSKAGKTTRPTAVSRPALQAHPPTYTHLRPSRGWRASPPSWNQTSRFLKRRRRFCIRRRVRFASPRPRLPFFPFKRADQSFFIAAKSLLRRAVRLRRAIKLVTGEAKPLSRPKTNASTAFRSPRTRFASPLPNIWATNPPLCQGRPHLRSAGHRSGKRPSQSTRSEARTAE